MIIIREITHSKGAGPAMSARSIFLPTVHSYVRIKFCIINDSEHRLYCLCFACSLNSTHERLNVFGQVYTDYEKLKN